MAKPITVRLVGGLGNQLFGYFAGAALAARNRVPLRLDTSWTRHGVTDHGIEIIQLELPGEWLRSDSWRTRVSAPGTIPARALAKILREVPSLGRPLRIHEAPGIGHDPSLLDQPPGTRLRGYFQSWEIVEYAVLHGYPRRPSLKRPSRWLSRIIDRAEREQPVAVHVRRGDYTKVNSLGLLGPKYYESAIKHVRARGVGGPIWLFSDEPDRARPALGKFGQGAELITSPEGPATEMIAMSHAAANVIANSTFSWWGAWMGTPSRPVVAPQPWFASGPEVKGLLPPRWLVLEQVHG